MLDWREIVRSAMAALLVAVVLGLGTRQALLELLTA